MQLPEKLQEIIDDFALASRQEKVEMLIQYSEALPPLPDWLRDERAKMDAVPECMTPVFLFAEKQPDGSLVFHFDIPPQSPTVRGLAAILANGLNGCQPAQIVSIPADFYAPHEPAGSYQLPALERLSGRAGAHETGRRAPFGRVNCL